MSSSLRHDFRCKDLWQTLSLATERKDRRPGSKNSIATLGAGVPTYLGDRMSKEKKSRTYRRLGLLASCSLAALLSGGGMPAAWAASCTNTITAAFDNPSGHTVANICVQNTSFTGSITNEGTISPSGITFKNGTINGQISSSGIIAGGISLDSASKIISTTGTAIKITGPTFSGGISNAGTISAGVNGIFVDLVSTFSGGISNSGTISAEVAGVLVQSVRTFSDGVSNSGTISAKEFGINLNGVSTFSSGISNSGTISAGFAGIGVQNVGSLSGGISNSGTILTGELGISVAGVSTFSGGISNSGTISAAAAGIFVSSVAKFGNNSLGGGISNSGMILAGIQGIAVSDVTQFGSNSLGGGISNSGTIVAGATGIAVLGVGTFSGGIGNSGTISAGAVGINVDFVSTFSGGISNAGTISAGHTGIFVSSVSSFSGGISNSGTISAGVLGIFVGSGNFNFGDSTFSGGIQNSGTIVAGLIGIFVHNVGTLSGGISNSGTIAAKTGIFVSTVTSFSGGIANTGMIVAAGNTGVGIQVGTVSTFSGGISNSGTISVANEGILALGVSTFSGGISNSGTISAVGDEGIFVSSVSTFSGNISNSGTISAAVGIFINSSVTFASGSAIVNSGTIIGTMAAIDVSNATSAVTINQVGGLISGAINLSTNADVLNVSGGTIAGSITSLGTASTLNQSGGLVLLSGTNSIGSATLTGGTLEIGDASHISTTLTLTNTTTLDVASGMLAGHGTLIGNAVIGNGGTLMPGGSIGTLTINGNLTFQQGSTYLVSLSPTQTSLTTVTGNVTINGGNVVLNAQAGVFKPQTNLLILTSTGTLTGTFNPTVSLATGSVFLIDPTLSFDAHDVFLSDKGSAFVLAPGATLNAQNAVSAINTFAVNGGNLPAGFTNLSNLTGNALNAVANQLGGQGQGSFAPTGFQAGSMFLNLMLNPYVEGRGAFGTGGPALAYAPDQSSALAAEAFSALALGPRGAFEPRMSFWASAYGGGGTIQGNATTGAATTTSQIYGFATGVDYQALPNTIFGLALGGGGTNWGVAQGLGGGHSDMFQAGIYGTSRIGPAYVSGALAYSLNDVTTTRTVTLAGSDTLQGNFAADVASGRLEAGYRLPYGIVAMTPYGAVQTQAMFLPSYAEYATSGSSQFALTYTNHTYSATRTELGAWFDSDVLADKGVKLYGRLAWAHDFDNEGTSTAFFQSLPGANFLINSAKPAPDGALVTAGFEYRLADGWSVLGKFDGEFSSTTAIFSGTGAIRKVW
jgi:uncharacterized protein with beta-barrel porin domain